MAKFLKIYNISINRILIYNKLKKIKFLKKLSYLLN